MLDNYYLGPLKPELVKPGDLLLKLPSNSAVSSGRGSAVRDVHCEGDRRLVPPGTKLQVTSRQVPSTPHEGSTNSLHGSDDEEASCSAL